MNMNRILTYLYIFTFLLFSFSASAVTPAEKIMLEYEDSQGASFIEAKGISMRIARVMIRKTPAAPVADKITEVSVLKLENADDSTKSDFHKNLEATLKQYTYVGKSKAANNDVVDVYISLPENDLVYEMVIFNYEKCTLNSLRGQIPVSLLMSMQKQIL